MKVVTDNLWLCEDCTMVAVNDDSTGIESARREREVRAAVHDMGPHLVCDSGTDTDEHGDQREDGYNEFSARPCDCCGSQLAGARTRFAILGE